MIFIPLMTNAIVICILAAELVAAALGKASADQLLVGSVLSGLLIILSFKLAKEAKLRQRTDPVSLDEQTSADV